jgi:hypothetical protein
MTSRKLLPAASSTLGLIIATLYLQAHRPRISTNFSVYKIHLHVSYSVEGSTITFRQHSPNSIGYLSSIESRSNFQLWRSTLNETISHPTCASFYLIMSRLVVCVHQLKICSVLTAAELLLAHVLLDIPLPSHGTVYRISFVTATVLSILNLNLRLTF